MASFGERYSAWIESLCYPAQLPDGIELLDPYRDRAAGDVVRRFAERFYADTNPRIGIFGINPGRFGAGTTGIMFTDPVALQEECGIEHQLGNRRELSSTFIYQTIAAYGGVKAFYRSFYLSALCPLGFTQGGKNVNFYDHPDLLARTIPFIVKSLVVQCAFPLRRQVAIILGSGKLRHLAERINAEHRFFDQLIILEHPRFIMQYRRRALADYCERYVCAYRQALRMCNCA